MAEGVTEDTDEEMSLVVVCTGTRSSRDVEDILERQWVKFWLAYEGGTGNGCETGVPYLRARARTTSQLIPPTLIHRTFTQDSRSLAVGLLRKLMNSTLVIRPKLLRTLE